MQDGKSDARPRPAAPKPEKQAATGPLVLIADAQEAGRAETIAALRATGIAFRHAEAATGDEALAVLRNGGVDLAFIDVQLPGINGTAVVGQARREGHEPFLVLTCSMVLPNWAMLSTELVAYEFLKKPCTPEDIGNALLAWERMRKPSRILLVESAPQARRLMTRVFGSSRFACEVEETDSGAHALKLAEISRFDIAFVDIALAGMSGLEAACQLQTRHPDVTVVMMLPADDGGLAASLKHFGLEKVLRKPFYARDVDAFMHQFHGLRRPYLMNALLQAEKRALAG